MIQVVLTAGVLTFLLLVWLAGWAWLSLFSHLESERNQNVQAGAAEAFLVGIAMLGLMSYLILWVFGRMSALGYWGLLGLQLALAIRGLRFAVRKGQHGGHEKRQNKGFCSIFLIWFLVLGLFAAQLPLSGYDARAIYGLKAKILADGSSIWGPDFRDPYRLHFASNYPLLIPILESFFFKFRALIDPIHPWCDNGVPLLFWAFVIAGTVLIVEKTNRFAPGWGFLGGLIWVFTPMAWRSSEGAGLSGSVDLCFAVFTAAAAIHVACGSSSRNRFELLLAGIYSGAAILIKQEGIITLGLMLLMIPLNQFFERGAQSIGGICARAKCRKPGILHLGFFLLGLVPFVVLSRGVHAGMPQQIYMRSYAAALSWDWLMQIVDRPLGVLGFALKELIGNHWGLMWLLLALALMMRRKRCLSPEVRYLRLFVVFLLTSYSGIFVVTPYPLFYHLSTAYARLVLHALPLATMIVIEQLVATGWLEVGDLSDQGSNTLCQSMAEDAVTLQRPRSGVSDSE